MYSRLNRLGVCVSHPNVTKLIQMCAKDHDRKVKLWQDNWMKALQHTSEPPEDSGGSAPSHFDTSCNPPVVVTCSFIIVSDNLDKPVTPRDMRVDHQVQSVHYFNLYAALDRVESSGLSSETVPNSADDIMAIPTSTCNPTKCR